MQSFLRLFLVLTLVSLPLFGQEPADFSKLLPLLPVVPEGWDAGEPEGSSTDAGGFKLSVAGRTYSKAGVAEGEEAPTASVNITDCGGSKEFLDATTTGWQESPETDDGYAKIVTIEGNRGFESYDKSEGSAMLWLVVNQRFLVQVEVTKQPAAELQTWLKRLDLKKLGALK